MAQPGTYVLEAQTNATLRESFVVQDDDGVAVDLTGYTALAELRKADGTLYLQLSTANGRIALGSDGSIELTVPVATMQALAAFDGTWDLLLKSGGGIVEAKLAGPAYVKAGVSASGSIP